IDLQETFNCIEKLNQIKSSGLSILQLDYILNHRPGSSVGLRDETAATLIEGLRKILEDNRNTIGFLDKIIEFNADALSPLTDADAIMTLFSPFQTSLIASKIDMSDHVSAEEIKFITEFDKIKLNPPNTNANKIALIANIKKVQTSATKFRSVAVQQKHNQIISQVASSVSIATGQAHILLHKLKLGTNTASLLAELENE